MPKTTSRSRPDSQKTAERNKSGARSPDDSRTFDLSATKSNPKSGGKDRRDADNGAHRAANRQARRGSARVAKVGGNRKHGALGRFCLWLVERFVAEHNTPATFITYIPQHGFGIASGCLIAWAARRKEPKILALNLAALGFFAWAFLNFNVPWNVLSARMTPAPSPRVATTSASLRVMTYNILRGQRGIEGLVAVVKEARPDVLCLQESDAWGGVGPVPSVEIARSLPGWHLASQGELSVISRFPVISSRRHPLRGATRVQEVVLKIAGRPVSVFNVHFIVRIGADMARRSISMKPEAAIQRELQLSQLLQALGSARAPFLVAGDFNTPPRGLIYHALATRLDNAWRQAGWGTGYSFPARLPLLRIDHIWMSRNVRATHCRVFPSRASDHRALIADLQIDFAAK